MRTCTPHTCMHARTHAQCTHPTHCTHTPHIVCDITLHARAPHTHTHTHICTPSYRHLSLHEPSRAEPGRAGPGQAGPGRAGPGRAGPGYPSVSCHISQPARRPHRIDAPAAMPAVPPAMAGSRLLRRLGEFLARWRRRRRRRRAGLWVGGRVRCGGARRRTALGPPPDGG
jgi:hypothetical protein